jgi:hypothetical protein
MSDKDCGGAAFPSSPAIGPNGIYRPVDIGCEGMTLRDYAAFKAMQGDLASQDEAEGHWANDSKSGFIEARARLYYAFADAMLKVRKE